MSKPSVCIIGGGAAGLCSALYLVRRGVRDVTVVDRAHPAAGQRGCFPRGCFSKAPSQSRRWRLSWVDRRGRLPGRAHSCGYDPRRLRLGYLEVQAEPSLIQCPDRSASA